MIEYNTDDEERFPDCQEGTEANPYGGPTILTASEILATGWEILAALSAAGITNDTYVEQTGGGVATVYIGPFRRSDNQPILVIGPGSFNWANAGNSLFYADALWVGPADNGEATPINCKTVKDVVAAVKAWLWRPAHYTEEAHVHTTD